MKISYFSDDVAFRLKEKRKISDWLKKAAAAEKKIVDNLTYVFVSDEKITDLNRKFLKHDYATDILTFDSSEDDFIAGEMFISVDTVKENAKYYSASFEIEILRVILHGMLHLCGYKDETEEEQKKFRELEEKYLLLF